MKKGFLVVMVLGLGLVALLGMLAISSSNTFSSMEEEVNSRWAQVENQMKRRADLIPNLVETVKGYASHEKEIFGHIADARSKLLSAGSVPEKIAANSELSSALGRLLVITEAYPDLKANVNFTRLMDELAGTENRIAVERQRYNESVKEFNTALRRIPSGLLAGMLGYHTHTYFEVAAADKETPKVKF